MAATLNIHVETDQLNSFEFGYASTDKVSAVTNWQDGNNIFVGVPDGSYFVFARKKNAVNQFLRYVVSVNCAGCVIATNGFFDITPSSCVIATNGFYDLTNQVEVSTGTLIIGINT